MTQKKEELIGYLIKAVKARGDQEESLSLPGWDASSWALLLLGAEIIELHDGEILIRKGDTGSDLYFLVTGKLEVSVPQREGLSITPLVSLGPGAVVGELTFFDNRVRSASVWSSGTSSLFRLQKSAFVDFKQAHPELACDLLQALGQILAGRLRRAQDTPMDRAGTV